MNSKNHGTILNTGEGRANFIEVIDRNGLNVIKAIYFKLIGSWNIHPNCSFTNFMGEI